MRFQNVAVMGALAITTPALAQNLYWSGGSTDISNGTPTPGLLSNAGGTWNTSLSNWASDLAGTTYGTWTDGAVAHFGPYTHSPDADQNTVVEVGSSFTLSGINAAMPNNRFNLRMILQSGTGNSVLQNLTLSGASPVVNTASTSAVNEFRLEKSVGLISLNGFRKTGPGTFDIYSASTGVGGTVDIRSLITNSVTSSAAGKVVVGGGGGTPTSTLRNVERFVIGGYGGNNGTATLTVSAPNTTSNNMLGDSAVVDLQGNGQFEYRGRSGVAQIETLGQIRLGSAGILNFENNNSGIGTLTLAHATEGLLRANNRSTIVVAGNADDTLRNNLVVQNTTLPKDVLLPWAGSNRGRFATIASVDNTLKFIAPTNITSTASLVNDASANYRFFGVGSTIAGTLGGNVTVNSLGLRPEASVAQVLDLGGNTLTVASGGITYQPVGSGDRTISNGTLTTTGDAPLYFTTGTSTSLQPLLVSANITGNIDVVKGGVAEVRYTGTVSNTYTGTTYVTGGLMRSQKTGGAIGIAGDAVVRSFGQLDLNSSNIATTSNVTVDENGLLSVAGGNTVNSLTVNNGIVTIPNQTLRVNNAFDFNGGQFNFNSGGAGTLQLAGSVTYNATSTTPALIQKVGGSSNLTVDLLAGNRTFNVSNSNTLGAGISEMLVSVPVTNGALTKTGSGTLELTSANTYAGGTTINNGTLKVNNLSGSGTGTGAVAVNGIGTLAGNGILSGLVTVASGGTIAPGNSIGTITVGMLTLAQDGIFEVEVAVPADKVVTTGASGQVVTINNALINVIALDGITAGQHLIIDQNSGADDVLGTFANSTGIFGAGVWQYQVLYNVDSSLATDSGNDVYLSVALVPEPGTFGALAALAGLALRRRRHA